MKILNIQFDNQVADQVRYLVCDRVFDRISDVKERVRDRVWDQVWWPLKNHVQFGIRKNEW